MSSAYSITAAVNPPRAVYLDYPLGHTSGRPLNAVEQLAIMRDTLSAFASIDKPGTIVKLNYQWQADDAWKDRVMRSAPKAQGSRSKHSDTARSHADSRVQRFASPQYQTAEDAAAADSECATCIFPEDPKTGLTNQKQEPAK